MFGMRRSFPLLLLFLPLGLAAQFSDDFSNGNFTSDPSWVGDHEKFIVQQQILRLYDEGAGQAVLATPSHVIADTQWDFWARMSFTPSDNNHPRIYLVSDTHELSGPLKGYFIQLGKTGTDNKRLFFYRQDGEDSSLLLTGSLNFATTANNSLRVRVIRDGVGNWELMLDPGGGHIYLWQGGVFDDTYTRTSWFGIRCRYTASNSRGFYFDDFRVGPVIPEAPPRVARLTVVSAAGLDVQFSRAVCPETAGQTFRYPVNDGSLYPVVAAVDPSIPHVVSLLFPQHLEVNHLYTIRISGVTSPDGQTMEAFEGEFLHYVSRPFDVVFNELMVNSRPVVSLPPHDWFELYNTTGLPIDLEGWVFQHGTVRRELPGVVILPGETLLCTSEAAYPLFAHYGNVVAIPGLAVNALPMGGGTLILWDERGEPVSFVAYTDRWYRNPAKAEGGWSLEKIDPYNFCQGAENWKASRDVRGGSPAMVNSVKRHNPDTSRPRLIRTGIVDSLTIRLDFSEPMNRFLLADTGNYEIDGGIGPPSQARPLLPVFSSVKLVLPRPLQAGSGYRVGASERLADCAGNSLHPSTARVGMPQDVSAGDVVINEVLFNPPPGGARYVEIYNRSQKMVDLAGMVLASKDTVRGVLTHVQYLAHESHLFFPGSYLLLTADTGAVKNTYMTSNPDAFLELDAMPAMTHSSGVIVLASRGHEVIDMLAFSEDMHLPLLTNPKGVALERLHPDRPTHCPSSWHSAARSAGYGTPAYRNSQYVGQRAVHNIRFEVHPRVFLPDGSGRDDLLHIHYALENPGKVANVRIFDSRGRMIRRLLTGELLGSSGSFSWDGTTDRREKAAVGMYVIHVEVVDPHGGVSHHRLTAVLAAMMR